MRKTTKLSIPTIVLAFFLIGTISHAQVGIGTTTPEPSTVLDISSTEKGVLVPRVDIPDLALEAPITGGAIVGLLVWNTNTATGEGFHYWDGAQWVMITTGTSNTGWKVLGNAGTDLSNFIGTTDGQALRFKISDQKAGEMDSDSTNTSFGYLTLRDNSTGTDNTSFGHGALRGNTTGNANSAMGMNALQLNTEGYNNTALGAYALLANTLGNFNTGVGVNALRYNTTGNNNTAVGRSALDANTTGGSNTALGVNSLFSNTTGTYNTAVGVSALYDNTTGGNNVAVGLDSQRYHTTGNFNTSLGSYSLRYNITGSENTAVGFQALWGQDGFSHSGNTAVGYNAMLNTTSGNLNTAVGRSSLEANTLGNYNTAIGNQALFSNTSGEVNTAMGYNALRTNSTGNGNTAMGTEALDGSATVNGNTAMGYRALRANTLGEYNTATGYRALQSNTTASFNTAMGNFALDANITGANNTAVGAKADVAADGLTNATAIGYQAVVNASNKVRLGNTAVTVIEGQVAYSFPSDKRFKYNIKNNVPGLAFIKKLQPVTYYFNEEKLATFMKTGKIGPEKSDIKNTQLHTGFLAQDVEKAARELGYNFDGIHAPENEKGHYSLAYSQFIMPVVKAVQEQQKIIITLQQANENLEKRLAKLEKASNHSEIERELATARNGG